VSADPGAAAGAPASAVLAWARGMGRLNKYLGQDLLGGPRPMKLATVINVQKAGTLPFVAVLMAVTGNRSVQAFVYLGLHGAYGLCWLLKDRVFPDPRWEVRVTLAGALTTWVLVLGLYWVAPVMLVTDWLGPTPAPPAWRLGAAVLVHTVGLAIMLVADAQKHFTLLHARGLIEGGMFRHVRHPNYLGEMMVYGAYALLVGRLAPWLILLWVWTQVFLVNMLNKEASLARHPQWAAYRARTGMLLPRLWRAAANQRS
jgi:protein-S-isoprenylcysteine O-methyltransferase Ste14